MEQIFQPRPVGISLPQTQDHEAVERGLALIEDAGADCAELPLAPLKVIVGGDLCRHAMARLEPIIGRRKLCYTVHAPLATNLMDRANLDAHLGVVRAGLRFCKAIGARTLVLHPGWHDPAVAEALPSLMETERAALRELALFAERCGVRIALENLPVIYEMLAGISANYGIEPRRVAGQIHAVGHPALVGTIDFSHAWISANHLGRDVVAELEPLALVAKHFHIHDSFGKAPVLKWASPEENLAYGLGDLHLPPGRGTVPYRRLFEALPLDRSEAVMMLEVDRRFWSAESLAESVAACRSLFTQNDQ